MIKVQELRIGNYLQNEKGSVTVVVQINRTWFCSVLAQHAHKTESYITAENESPIQIDEEWLQKFGFEHTNSLWRLNSVELEDCGNEFTPCANLNEMSIGTSIQYVHQLQNLYFILQGEELAPLSF